MKYIYLLIAILTLASCTNRPIKDQTNKAIDTFIATYNDTASFDNRILYGHYINEKSKIDKSARDFGDPRYDYCADIVIKPDTSIRYNYYSEPNRDLSGALYYEVNKTFDGDQYQYEMQCFILDSAFNVIYLKRLHHFKNIRLSYTIKEDRSEERRVGKECYD